MNRLASAPTALSVPIASPPFPPRGQLFHFQFIDPSNRRWFITVIFRYSQDETALHVLIHEPSETVVFNEPRPQGSGQRFPLPCGRGSLNNVTLPAGSCPQYHLAGSD